MAAIAFLFVFYITSCAHALHGLEMDQATSAGEPTKDIATQLEANNIKIDKGNADEAPLDENQLTRMTEKMILEKTNYLLEGRKSMRVLMSGCPKDDPAKGCTQRDDCISPGCKCNLDSNACEFISDCPDDDPTGICFDKSHCFSLGCKCNFDTYECELIWAI